jgi:hypothetical protein
MLLRRLGASSQKFIIIILDDRDPRLKYTYDGKVAKSEASSICQYANLPPRETVGTSDAGKQLLSSNWTFCWLSGERPPINQLVEKMEEDGVFDG